MGASEEARSESLEPTASPPPTTHRAPALAFRQRRLTAANVPALDFDRDGELVNLDEFDLECAKLRAEIEAEIVERQSLADGSQG